MRLDKYLSHSGYGSRKECKELIRKGLVSVNGINFKNDDYKTDEKTDEVIVLNDVVSYQEYIFIMLYKPKGVVSATIDNLHKTVIDLIDKEKRINLFPVGRLDIDTSGLLLITNDGKTAHNLLSPGRHVDKKYYVEFDGEFKPEYLSEFNSGINIGDYITRPSKIERLNNNSCYITISEGKFHQVKRMFIALNMKVTELKRIEFGSLKLDETLNPGEYRELTEEEIKSIK